MFSSQFARSDFTRSHEVKGQIGEQGELKQMARFALSFRASVDKEVDKTYPGLTPSIFPLRLTVLSQPPSPLTAPPAPAPAGRAIPKKSNGTPDPTKDIIMSRFHYSPEVKLRIYDNLADAVKSLE